MSNIVWFEVPADNVERAKSFYGGLFGWKIEKMPGAMDYWHLDTGGSDDTPDGGIMKRQSPQQQGITNYVGVPSVDQFVDTRSRNSAAESSCPRQRCRKWATSPSARTRRTTCSVSGRWTGTRNSDPEHDNSLDTSSHQNPLRRHA
jgi:hypothetical protein